MDQYALTKTSYLNVFVSMKGIALSRKNNLQGPAIEASIAVFL
ncbi:MAG TPA: hypothetical protein VMF91_07170 [Bryobacteraceae bacterium]|nr:hypothetical protein [Bryobacteraceae bacterium]